MNLPLMLLSVTGLLSEVFSERVQKVLPYIVMVIAIFFLTQSIRRRQRNLGRPTTKSEPVRDIPPRANMELRRDMDSLMVELQELSRKISAEIDTRFAKLESVIRDADRRIAVLHRLSREANPEKPLISSSTDQVDNRHTVVYELADAGFTPVDIARELGKTPGEVELILNLRRKPTGTRD